MIAHRIPLAVALLLLALLAGCAAPVPGPRGPDQPTDPESLYLAGRYVEAAEAWMVEAERPEGPGDAARLRAVEAWLAAGQTASAEDVLARIDPAMLRRALRFRYDLARAELALNRGDFELAERVVALAPDRVPAELQARLARLRELLDAADPESPAARLRALRESLAGPGFEPARALALLIDIPLDPLDALVEAHGDEPDVGPWLRLGRLLRANLLDPPALREVTETWVRAFPASGVEVDAVLDWVRAWRESRPMPARVAVLLPGEGPLAAAGEVLRDGLVTAWMDLPRSRRPELDFLYLASTPDAAVGAWFEARERGADFILGPLDRAQIPALLALPDPAVPMLLLNRPPPEAQWPTPAQPLAILALPPEEEAELAAIRALVDGGRRALVIAQDTEFGGRIAGRFVETFELGGGRVVGRVDYPPRETDFTDRLEDALRLVDSEARIDRISALLGEPVEAEPHRRTDIDLVFLAARDEARQVQPQLRFLDLAALPTFATSHVLTADRDRDLDGLMLPLSPWLLADSEHVEARAGAERAFPALQRSVTLSQLHALGRDAVALLPWLDAMKRDPRLTLSAGVGRLRLADGVALERDLPWAIVREGRPVRPR